MMKRYAAFAGLLLLLSACGATTQPAPQGTVEAAKPIAEVKPSVTTARPIELAKLPEKKPEPKTEPTFDVPEIDVLKGKDISEIQSVFGDPVLRRKDKPTEIWQYLSSSCALHLIFYPDNGKSGPLTVKYIAMNDRQSVKDVPIKACFESQLRKLGAEKLKALTS